MKKALLTATLLNLPLGIVHAEAPLAPPVVVNETLVDESARSREDIQSIEAQVRVESVDLAERLLSFKNADGEVNTVKVPEEITRLEEVKAGDLINLSYYLSIVYELRAPTEEEKKNPGSLFGMAGKADKDKAPAAGAMAVAHAVTTIEKIDAERQMVTLKGPAGHRLQVKVHDPKVLEGLKRGDSVAVTVSEGLAMGIEPAAK
jgi:hypothetical protein